VAKSIERGDLDFRHGGGPQPALGERARRAVLHRLLEDLAHHGAAIALLEQRQRHLAGSEARQPHGGAELAQPLVELLVELLGRQPHRELPLETLGEGFRYLHVGFYPLGRRVSCALGWARPTR
jgi:hypothetical protein